MMTNIYQTDLAIHPGEFLEETLEDIGMSQRELANRLGRPVQAINEIIKGKKSITSVTALELEDVLGIPSHIWIGLESEYQTILARQEELKQMEEESSMVKNFPYADLVKLKLVKETRKAIERVDELKRFFSVAKLVQIQRVKAYQPAFRVSNHNNISHEAIATWIQVARIKAQAIQTESFDKKRLKENLSELKSLMNYDSINKSIKELQQLLNSCGVALVLLPHFKKTQVNGATFWLDNDKAVIVMSLRGSLSDVFWFSLFHEIGHIMLHPKREFFLEDGYNDPKLEAQEIEADEFASQLLISEKDFDKFVSIGIFSITSVRSFAEEQGIKPSIIVGRLMRYKHIAYNDYKLSKLRDRYKWGT